MQGKHQGRTERRQDKRGNEVPSSLQGKEALYHIINSRLTQNTSFATGFFCTLNPSVCNRTTLSPKQPYLPLLPASTYLTLPNDHWQLYVLYTHPCKHRKRQLPRIFPCEALQVPAAAAPQPQPGSPRIEASQNNRRVKSFTFFGVAGVAAYVI